MKRTIGIFVLIFMAVLVIKCNYGEGDSECLYDCGEAELNLEEPVVVEEEPIKEETPEELGQYFFPSNDEVEVDFVDQEKKKLTGINPDYFKDDNEITPEQLTAEDLDKIDVLRDTIEQGIGIGRAKYLEKLSITLNQMGIHNDYESLIMFGDLSEEEGEIEECPFAKYYDNGFEPSEVNCDYLINLAKVETYSELTKVLDKNPIVVENPTYKAEADFWYEQGAISGIEEFRVITRADLKQRSLCNKIPSPVESSYEKGIAVGREHFVNKINVWLSSKGLAPDYPIMSTPMQVCNADQTMLLPVKKTALEQVKSVVNSKQLCEDYTPPSEEGILQYNQAKIDYEKGVKEGISAEFAMAAIKVFKVIPCNVSDPIVIDLDGDGIELLPVELGVNFDLYSIGTKIAIGWVAPNDGLLVFDRNGNGTIDDGGELFGNISIEFEDGFDQLEELDRTEHSGNGDGVIDKLDEAFSRLAVWKDANTNGVTDAGELLSLESLGIKKFDLFKHQGPKKSRGMNIPRTSVITTGDKDMLFGDAFLTSAPYASNR